jgi:hypothetical protein
VIQGHALAWGLLVVLSSRAVADPEVIVSDQPAPAAAPALSLERLACMSWCELEQLYRRASPGAIPTGYLRGRAIYCPGAPLTPARSKMTQAVWHGKLFCPDETLVNRWCLGLHAVHARVCVGPGWLDGNPSILMDYRGVSHVIWKDVRDEIREVAPGLYVGIMYRCKSGQPQMKMFFALELSPCNGCAAVP